MPVSALFVPSAMQCDDNQTRAEHYSTLFCGRGKDARVNSGMGSFLRTELQGLWDVVTLTGANTHTNAPLVLDRQRQTVGQTGCVC